MLTVSDELRHYLDMDGAPLPLIDVERARLHGHASELHTESQRPHLGARPGIRAVGEADSPPKHSPLSPS